MNKQIARFNYKNMDDFFSLHSEEHGGNGCYCVAWWIPTWTGWEKRTAEQNRTMREELCLCGQYDGYLLYVNDVVAGWCQVGPRDRLVKLNMQFKLAPNPDTWAITCFFILKKYRRCGMASYMLNEILQDLKKQNVRRVEAFPKRGNHLNETELWTGPENLYLREGFKFKKDDSSQPIMVLEF